MNTKSVARRLICSEVHFYLLFGVCVFRFLVCVVFVGLLVGCYPEPKVKPVKVSPECVERMCNATHSDGTPIVDARLGRRKKGGSQAESGQ